MAVLRGGRIAWFAMAPVAAEKLRVEDRVLGLVRSRCGFPTPVVSAASSEGWTLRSMVPGRVDPEGLAAWLRSEPALVTRVAQFPAHMLAQQHTRIIEADVTGWVPTTPSWPLPRPDIEDRLPLVTDDPSLKRRIPRLLDAYDDLVSDPHDSALLHGDLGLHNMAFDPDSGNVNGVFDYGSAAWADRHVDFRYLVFGAVQDALPGPSPKIKGHKHNDRDDDSHPAGRTHLARALPELPIAWPARNTSRRAPPAQGHCARPEPAPRVR